MTDRKLVPLTKEQAQFLIVCIDTHQKQFGLKTSGNCFAMAQLIDQHFKEEPQSDEVGEAA